MLHPSLKVSYKTQWLGTLCAFVTETAQALGAEESERSALHLAAEETAMHILEAIPHDELEDAFEVTCVPHRDGVEYVFRNIGPPINVEALPDYDENAPEDSIEGLRLFLARKMVDRLEFVNLGRDGWRTTIFKQLQSVHSEVADWVPDDESLEGVKPESVTTTLASPEDAFDIVQMAYMNYRYSYAKEAFYYAEKLEVELREKRIFSFIARAESGPIVGHFAFIRNLEHPTVMEVGAVMVRPEYRRSRGLLSLIKAVMRYRDESIGEVQLFMSNLVTAHAQSQKLAMTMRMKPMALNLSTHPRARFLGFESGSGRESNLYAVGIREQPAPAVVFVPEVHFDLATTLFGHLGIAAEVKVGRAESTDTGTHWQSSIDEQAQYGVLRADNFGEDFFNDLRAEALVLSQNKVDTLALRLPAWVPQPADLDDELRKQGFFFCGFVFKDSTHWQVLYTRLTHQRFSFDDVEVYGSEAEALKAYVKKSYETLLQRPVRRQPNTNSDPDNNS